MKIAAAPVSEALILICEKCGKKLVGDTDSNPARDLQQELKAKIYEQGLKGQVRAVVTTCMDVCPKNEIAVAISPARGGDDFLTLEMNELSGAADALLKRARS